MNRLFAFFAIAVLGACSQTPFINIYPQVHHLEVRSNFYAGVVSQFSAAGGPTIVRGTPQGGATPTEIVSALRLPHFLSKQGLTAIDNTKAAKGIHLVLTIAPNPTASADAVCRGEVTGAEAGEQLRVLGVFCRSSRAMSEAVVFAKGSPPAGDPAFAKALNRLIASIMPPVDPNRDQANIRRPNP
ncbi:MAG: hypothetical protein ACPGFA_12275 [Pikeienuella sp.]